MKRRLSDRDDPVVVYAKDSDKTIAKHLLHGAIQCERYDSTSSHWSFELEIPSFYEDCSRSLPIQVVFLMCHLCKVIDYGVSQELFVVNFPPKLVMRADQICRFTRRDIEKCYGLEFRHVNELVQMLSCMKRRI
jgi:hypothetical protein